MYSSTANIHQKLLEAVCQLEFALYPKLRGPGQDLIPSTTRKRAPRASPVVIVTDPVQSPRV